MSTVQKILAGVLLLVVLYTAYNWYQNRNMPQMPMMIQHQRQYPETEEQYSGGEDGTLKCTMYYTNWCKFCKKAKPEWKKFEDEFHGKTVNGKKILVVSIDCTDDDSIAEQENIEGYPTFKFNLDGKYYDYPDQPVFEKFKTFVEYLVGLQQ